MVMSMMDIAPQRVHFYDIFSSNYHNKIVTGENQREYRMDVLKIEKTPTLWYTLYAVDELAFPPSRGGDSLTHDDVAILLAFLQLVVSIAALLKD